MSSGGGETGRGDKEGQGRTISRSWETEVTSMIMVVIVVVVVVVVVLVVGYL